MPVLNDKRAQFFFGAAMLCFVLVPVAPADFRNLTIAIGVVYVVLAVASALDYRGRH